MLKKIKNTIRDYVIILFFLTGIPYLRYLYLKTTKGPLLRVLAFHDVESKDHFDKLISFLDEKFNIISPKDFEQNKLKKDEINILLTFDDGYKSWMQNVLPVLKQRNLKGIFFISSGFIKAGEENREEEYLEKQLNLKNYRPPLSWRDLKTLKEADMAIGGHTTDHYNLARMDKEKIKKEIKKDKNILEDKLDQVLSFFAYPFGHDKAVSQEVIKQVKEAGYSYGFTTNINFNYKEINQFKLNRDCIDSKNSLLLNIAKIYGSYDLIKII